MPRLLLAVAAGLVLLAAAGAHGFQIEEATVDTIQQGFSNGSLSSVQLVRFYLDRIVALNPLLRAVIEVNPDALRQAARADAERRSGSKCGPLHGVPVLLKDNIATRDALNTTAGSFALLGSKTKRDAGVVSRLRRAGAVVLGKANMDEWSNFRALHGTDSWSARGGQAKNPYVLSADPCGSSTGPAIAAAANMAAVTLGTETAGSILCPASLNSVVGIKPTVGLTSRAGVIPITHRQDTVGPICRTVKDAVHVLDAIVGYDALDAAATQAASKYIPHGGYTQFLKKDGLKGKRIGVPNGFFTYPNGTVQQRVYQQHLDTIREQGAIVIEHLDIQNLSDILDTLNNGQQIGVNGIGGNGDAASNTRVYHSAAMRMPAGMIGAGLDDGTGASDAIDRGVLLELGLAAMEELVKVAQVNDPLWLPSLDSGLETLNYDEYCRAFAGMLGPSPAGFVSEATRDVGVAIVGSVDLVDSLMDAARWSEMFPCVVARASTREMISSGMGGTLNGTIQLVLSPLVPIREVTFLRFCKQHAEGLWAVVDISVDGVLRPDAGGSAAAGYIGCRLLPSGCVVEDMRNGYSKIALPAELKLSLNAYLSDLLYSPVRSLADVIAFNNAHPIEEKLEEFGQSIFLVAENTTGIGATEKAAINQLKKLSADGLEKLMKEHKLDAVVTPNDALSPALAMGGMPGITVPARYGKLGVPFGLCFGGLKGYEPRLIEIAYAFEQVTRARKTPTFMP